MHDAPIYVIFFLYFLHSSAHLNYRNRNLKYINYDAWHRPKNKR